MMRDFCDLRVSWVGLGWVVLGLGLGWVGLGWVGLGWGGLVDVQVLKAHERANR